MTVRSRSRLSIAGLTILCVGLAGCSPSADDTASSANDSSGNKKGGVLSRLTETPVTVPEGTNIVVVLDQSLSSNVSRAGEEFQATVVEPVVIDSKTVVASHAHARGRVVSAVPSGRLQTPAELSFQLTAVEVNGAWRDISTTAVGARGKSHKTRDVEFIGGGAAVGALIGGLAGHGKGAAIGALAGGGAGTGAAAYTGKKDITFPAEAHVTFRLRQPFTVNVKR